MCDKKSCAYTLLKCYFLFPATELDLLLQTLKQMSLKKGENISCVVKVLGARLKIAYQKSHTAFFFLFPVQSEWNAKEVGLSPRRYSRASQGNKLSFTSPPPPSQKKYSLFLCFVKFSVWYIYSTDFQGSTSLTSCPISTIQHSLQWTLHSSLTCFSHYAYYVFIFSLTWIKWIEGSNSAFITTSQFFQYVSEHCKISCCAVAGLVIHPLTDDCFPESCVLKTVWEQKKKKKKNC